MNLKTFYDNFELLADAPDGTLFRGRYKSILVEEDSYLLQLVRYIHRNPERAGIVEKPDQYQWSSHKGYVSKAKKWNWLHKGFILSMLTSKKSHQIKQKLQKNKKFKKRIEKINTILIKGQEEI